MDSFCSESSREQHQSAAACLTTLRQSSSARSCRLVQLEDFVLLRVQPSMCSFDRSARLHRFIDRREHLLEKETQNMGRFWVNERLQVHMFGMVVDLVRRPTLPARILIISVCASLHIAFMVYLLIDRFICRQTGFAPSIYFTQPWTKPFTSR